MSDRYDRIFDAIVLFYASLSWFGYIKVEQFDVISKLGAIIYHMGSLVVLLFQ